MSTSHGSFLPGMSRSETQKPHKPALGVEPLPTAPSSYIDQVSTQAQLTGHLFERWEEVGNTRFHSSHVFRNERVLGWQVKVEASYPDLAS